MKPIKIHTPQPQTHLPAHEQTARRGRAANALPNFLTPRKPSTRPTPTPTGRKTTYIDYPSLPSTQHPHHTNP